MQRNLTRIGLVNLLLLLVAGALQLSQLFLHSGNLRVELVLLLATGLVQVGLGVHAGVLLLFHLGRRSLRLDLDGGFLSKNFLGGGLI